MNALVSRPRKALLLLLALATIMTSAAPGFADGEDEEELPHVWVYSESLNYRHASIDHAKEVLAQLAVDTEAFTVEFTEDHTTLTREVLERTDVALFLSPSGIKDPGEVVYVNYERAPFTEEQRSMFVDWISCGGGFVAVHQAADSYDDWPEWDELVGAKFLHHPIWYTNPEATIGVVGGDHPAVSPWAGETEFNRPDEYYAWKPGQGPEDLTTDFEPLLTMRGYTDPAVALTWGLTFAEEQPLAWTSTFRGLNRSFYTNLGHAAATWDEPDFQDHLINGTLWVAEHEITEGCFMGPVTAPVRPLSLAVLATALFLLLPFVPALAQDNGGVTSPDDSLVFEVLIEDGDNATGIAVGDDGRVYYTETEGTVKMWDPTTGLVSVLGHLPVAGEWCVACLEPWLGEGGIHGFLLAPDFADSGKVYISWSPAQSHCDVDPSVAGETNAGCYHLSEFTVLEPVAGAPVLDVSSERIILTWPFSRYPLQRGSAEELLITREESPHFGWTRQSAHHGGGIDLMPDGSIVISVGDNTLPESSEGYGPRDPRPEKWWRNAERTAQNPLDRRGKLLRVNPDGSVPADNPFVDVEGHDPYIYAMGMRNPYRAAIDPNTGTVYSGQVGPDASVDDPMRGPAGQEELNVVYPGGLGTTPDDEVQEPYNGGYPRCIANGLPYHEYDYVADVGSEVDLDCTPFHHPVLWYPKTYANGTDNPWPQLEGSGSTIMPHLVYDYDGAGGLPADFKDSLLLFDWSRGWMATVPVNDDGSLDVSPDQVKVRAQGMNGPIDAAIGPDGAVYVIEHGGYVVPLASRIGRFTCGAPCGNEAPLPLPATAGSTPTSFVWLLVAAALAIPMVRRFRVVA